jgi:hypothetical protein
VRSVVFKRLVPVIAVLFALSMSAAALFPSYALDDDAYDGYAADSLTIKVGYMGGPYYTKKVFTLDELESMDTVTADYTFIDNMPSVVIDHAKGVRLSDIIDSAGIDMNSVQNFYFYTVDKQSSYFTSYSKTELLDTVRYCYYSLPDNFDSDAGVGNEDATSIAEPVDTIIAYADDWNRVIQGAEFGSDYENLSTATRFRLIFGQVDASTRTASRSAKWIHEIDVQLGGSPTITVSADSANLDMKVGSTKKLEVSVKNADDAIQTDKSQIQWSSDNEDAVTVDSDGNITVTGEGTAHITASYGGSSVVITVNGSKDSSGGGEVQQDQQNQVQDEQSGTNTGSAGGGTSAGGSSGNGTAVSGTSQNAGSGNAASSSSSGSSGSGSNAEEKEKTPTAGNSLKGVTLDSSGGQTGSSQTLPDAAGSVSTGSSTEGGEQNWRVYEMSADASELPDIEKDNPLLGFTRGAAAAVFIGGCAAEFIISRLRFGGRRMKAFRPRRRRLFR